LPPAMISRIRSLPSLFGCERIDVMRSSNCAWRCCDAINCWLRRVNVGSLFGTRASSSSRSARRRDSSSCFSIMLIKTLSEPESSFAVLGSPAILMVRCPANCLVSASTTEIWYLPPPYAFLRNSSVISLKSVYSSRCPAYDDGSSRETLIA